MDTAEEVRMNLASLQRIDPYIIRIKESASQVIKCYFHGMILQR